MTGRSITTRRAALQAVATLAALSFLALTAPPLRADVTGDGDVTPQGPTDLPIDGGQATSDIIVGGTDLEIGGTATGQLTIDQPSFTEPLVSDNGTIGGNIFGLGVATVAGLNSEWSVTNSMVVGSEGQGTLEIQSGARVISSAGTQLPTNGTPNNDSGYDLWFGRYSGSQGFGLVDGFASLLLSGNASIGHDGFGRVDVTNGGRFVTRATASIGTVVGTRNGEQQFGDGYVSVDGQASRWTIGLVQSSNPSSTFTDDGLDGRLYVGREGHGVLTVSNQGIVRVERDVFVGGEGSAISGPEASGQVTVTGANSQLQILGNLHVGSEDGNSGGQLEIGAQGLVRADGKDPTQGGFIGTRVGRTGFVNMSGGMIVTPNLENFGVLRGAGTVDVPTLLTNNGDIRNAASVANEREQLLFRGPVTNTTTGIIESIGGEMEFQAPVTNDGLIFGKDAIFRFKDDLLPLAGAGSMKLDNTIVEVTSNIPIPIQALTLEPSKSQILGSVSLGGLDVTLGNTFSQLAVTGDANVGGTLNIGLGSGYTPQIGDSFEILDAASRTGVFSTLLGTAGPGGFWNVTYTPTSVFLNFGTTASPIFASDFNGDGMVNAADLAVWQTHLGMMPATAADGDANGDGKVDGADFAIWQQQNGSHFPVVPAAGAVPEPSACLLALTALAAFRRKRSS